MHLMIQDQQGSARNLLQSLRDFAPPLPASHNEGADVRDQRQGIAQGLGCAGLDSALGHAGRLSRSHLRQTASRLAGRQLTSQTCEKGVENGIRQVGSPNRLILFGFPTPTVP